MALSRVKSLNGLYLTSFDARRIRINKKVKEFYESLRLYHDTTNNYPNVIAIEIPVAIPAVEIPALVIPIVTTENRFIDYQYVEAQAELIEENKDERKSDIKVIRFT